MCRNQYLLKGGDMKQLTDAERLGVAMCILDERQIAEYAVICKVLKLDCERNGFYNTPAECEDFECHLCEADDDTMRKVDCPYVG